MGNCFICEKNLMQDEGFWVKMDKKMAQIKISTSESEVREGVSKDDLDILIKRLCRDCIPKFQRNLEKGYLTCRVCDKLMVEQGIWLAINPNTGKLTFKNFIYSSAGINPPESGPDYVNFVVCNNCSPGLFEDIKNGNFDKLIKKKSGSGKKGCFIATAAYGSIMAREVFILQSFRDQFLLKNKIGIALTKWYYRISPGISGIIEKNPYLRNFVRVMLNPIVRLCKYFIQMKSK